LSSARSKITCSATTPHRNSALTHHQEDCENASIWLIYLRAVVSDRQKIFFINDLAGKVKKGGEERDF
jgi:hypothetical protein